MRNSSVKWGHMGKFDLDLNKYNFPTNPRGHLSHFGLGSIFYNYYNLNCKLMR